MNLVRYRLVVALLALSLESGCQSDSAPRGLMLGIFIAIIAAVALNFMLPLGGSLGLLISCAIGVFGVMVLVYSTSGLLHDSTIDSPIAGALMLFAGIFNVFVAVIHILLYFTGRD